MIVSFPETLKKLREERKLSQRQLAEKVNVSTSMIGLYETGSRMPSYETLLRLQRVFGVTTDYLLGADFYTDTALDVNGLTPEQIQAVYEVIEQFKRANGCY